MARKNESFLLRDLPLLGDETALKMNHEGGGRSFSWFRGEATIEGEWIFLNRQQSENYSLHEATDLVFDLAALPRPLRPTDALAFAKKYGLLRFAGDWPDYRETFAYWEKMAHQFQILLSNYYAWRSLGENGQKVEFVRLLNEGLKGVHLQFSSGLIGEESDEFILDMQANNLIGLAYYQAAQLMQSQQAINRCSECSRYFALRNKRMLFCSKSCAGTSRSRRYNEKKRSGKIRS